MFSGIGAPEIIVVAIVFLVLFGSKKLPEAARSIGKSARVFKSEVSEMKEEDRQREADQQARDSDPTSTTPTTGGSPVDEAKPKTDNESGPAS